MSDSQPRNFERQGAGLFSSNFSTSVQSTNSENRILSIAERSIARDLEEDHIEEDEQQIMGSSLSRTSTQERRLRQYSLTSKQRRPSHVASAPRPFLGLQPEAEVVVPSDYDFETTIEEERELLQDNKIISGTDTDATETTRLLNASDPEAAYGTEPGPEEIDQKWEDAVLAGKITTTWQREAKVIGYNSIRLIITFLLQVSLTFTSVFTAGHLGKDELAAVALGGMTAIVTGYSVYYGLVTSLDTLCAQAYGSGRKKLVGLYMQRNVYFLWTCTIPIGIIWIFSPQILTRIVPEKDVAILAGRYLRVLLFGAPGFALFESSKRYVQAQGRFNAALCVLLVAAPSNVLLQYIFVWHFKWGYIGCPTAIAIVQNLLPLSMFLYVRFIGGLECWPGFSRKAFQNWGPMIRLALPGFIMLFAEILAFEVITLAAGQISATHLATNAILQSLSVVAYQIPFPLSIAGATRVANLIGAGLPDAARVTARVMFVAGTVTGLFNMIVLSALREYIPYLYTREPDVIALAAAVLPINAAFQLFDALAAQCNGLLRGLGRQRVGGYICLFAFYCIAIPVSFSMAFGLGWDLAGLWCGPAVGLLVQFVLESIYIHRTSWHKASEEAARRNAIG